MRSTAEDVRLSADEALTRLMQGNQRFLRGEVRSGAFRRELLADLAKAQRPYATILGCSDSRVPPEWLFDTGLGELFVVRVAGNMSSRRRLRGACSTRGRTCRHRCSWSSATKDAGRSPRRWPTKTRRGAVSFPDSTASGAEHPPRHSGFRSATFSRRTVVTRRRKQRAVDGSPDPGFAGRTGACGGRAHEGHRRGL